MFRYIFYFKIDFTDIAFSNNIFSEVKARINELSRKYNKFCDIVLLDEALPENGLPTNNDMAFFQAAVKPNALIFPDASFSYEQNDHALGDLTRASFLEIWKSSENQQILSGVRSKMCQYAKYYKVNRLLAWMKEQYRSDGDVFLDWMDSVYKILKSLAAKLEEIRAKKRRQAREAFLAQKILFSLRIPTESEVDQCA